MTSTGEGRMDYTSPMQTSVWSAGLAILLAAAVTTEAPGQAARSRREMTAPIVQPDLPRYAPTSQQLAGIEISPELDRLLQRLTSSSYAERELATADLLTADRIGNDELYAALDRYELTAEQRHRLLLVVRDRVLNKPRGAVGIRVDRRFWPDQIVIQELLPELPARRVLEIGDRITHVEGEPLVSWDAFVRAVQSRLPGSTVSITIERPIGVRKPRRDARIDPQAPEGEGPAVTVEKMEIELELGSAEKLRDPNTGQPSQGGPVLVERQSEADQAMQTWGPKPRQIEITE